MYGKKPSTWTVFRVVEPLKATKLSEVEDKLLRYLTKRDRETNRSIEELIRSRDQAPNVAKLCIFANHRLGSSGAEDFKRRHKLRLEDLDAVAASEEEVKEEEGCERGSHQTPDDLEAQFQALQEEMKELKNEVKTLRQEINSLQRQHRASEECIESLQQDFQANAEEIASVREDTARTQVEVASLKAFLVSTASSVAIYAGTATTVSWRRPT